MQTGGVTIERLRRADLLGPAALQRANRDAVQLCSIVDDVQHNTAGSRRTASGATLSSSKSWGSYASFRDPEGNWLHLRGVGRATCPREGLFGEAGRSIARWLEGNGATS